MVAVVLSTGAIQIHYRESVNETLLNVLPIPETPTHDVRSPDTDFFLASRVLDVH